MPNWTSEDLRQNAVIMELKAQVMELRAWRDDYKFRMAKDQVLARLIALEKKLDAAIAAFQAG